MPKLSPVSWKELVRRLHQLEFEGPYQGAKHPYMLKGDLVLTIPNPHEAVKKWGDGVREKTRGWEGFSENGFFDGKSKKFQNLNLNDFLFSLVSIK